MKKVAFLLLFIFPIYALDNDKSYPDADYWSTIPNLYCSLCQKNTNCKTQAELACHLEFIHRVCSVCLKQKVNLTKHYQKKHSEMIKDILTEE